MFDRILVPTDGSDPALTAAREALALATEQDATVHALYVIEPISLEQYAIGSTPVTAKHPGLTEEQRAGAKAALTDIRDLAEGDDVAVTTAITRGQAGEEIITYATNNEVDLIVMGTHGRSGVDRLLIGSVTERVVRHSPIKVLTVRQ